MWSFKRLHEWSYIYLRYMLGEEGFKAVVKPRKNSRVNTKSEARRRTIKLYRIPGIMDGLSLKTMEALK